MTSSSDSSATLADLGDTTPRSMRDAQIDSGSSDQDVACSQDSLSSRAAELPVNKLQDVPSNHGTNPELTQDGFEKLEKPHNHLKNGAAGVPVPTENNWKVAPEDQAKAPQTNMKRMITPKGELIYVGWDGPDDPADPRNWTPFRKWTISICLYTFTASVGQGFQLRDG